MTDTDRASAARKVLDVLEALTNFPLAGARNSELARLTRMTPVQVTRAMDELVAKGWARRSDDTGLAYPTSTFTNLTFRVLNDFGKAQQRLADTRHAMTHG